MEQARERSKYRLGFGILRLASAVAGRLDITQQGRPVCEQLAAKLGETVNIAVRQRALRRQPPPGARAHRGRRAQLGR